MIQTSATDALLLQATSLHATDTSLQIMVHTLYIAAKNFYIQLKKHTKNSSVAELKPRWNNLREADIGLH